MVTKTYPTPQPHSEGGNPSCSDPEPSTSAALEGGHALGIHLLCHAVMHHSSEGCLLCRGKRPARRQRIAARHLQTRHLAGRKVGGLVGAGCWIDVEADATRHSVDGGRLLPGQDMQSDIPEWDGCRSSV